MLIAAYNARTAPRVSHGAGAPALAASIEEAQHSSLLRARSMRRWLWPARTPQKGAALARSRQCGVLLWRTGWPQPAQHGARAQQARVMRLLHKCSWRSTSHHGLALEERGLSPAQHPFAGPKPTTASAAWRARSSKLQCSSLETAGAAHAPRETRGAGLAFEAAASTSHHFRALEERGLSPAQRPFAEPKPTTASAAWRARAASSSAAPPP